MPETSPTTFTTVELKVSKLDADTARALVAFLDRELLKAGVAQTQYTLTLNSYAE